MTFTLIDICDADGRVVEPEWLARAEGVHRQLRELPADYPARLQRIFAGGARMTVATEDDAVIGLAVWRHYEDTYSGVKFYIDDLITDETQRSRGAGRALLAHLEAEARRVGARQLILDSGVQRHRAHAFYFREGFFITSHNFKKSLV